MHSKYIHLSLEVGRMRGQFKWIYPLGMRDCCYMNVQVGDETLTFPLSANVKWHEVVKFSQINTDASRSGLRELIMVEHKLLFTYTNDQLTENRKTKTTNIKKRFILSIGWNLKRQFWRQIKYGRYYMQIQAWTNCAQLKMSATKGKNSTR